MKDNQNWKNTRSFLQFEKVKSVNIWIIMMSTLTLCFLLFSIYVPYSDYKKYIGIVKEGEKNDIQLYMEDDAIVDLQTADLIVDNKMKKWKTKEISEEYYLDEKLGKYRTVTLEIDLPKKDQIKNNIIEITLKHKKKTLYERVIEKIKGGYKT